MGIATQTANYASREFQIKWSVARVLFLPSKLSRNTIQGFWAKLFLDTLVAGANTTINNVLAAIRTVDQIISDGDQAYWKR